MAWMIDDPCWRKRSVSLLQEEGDGAVPLQGIFNIKKEEIYGYRLLYNLTRRSPLWLWADCKSVMTEMHHLGSIPSGGIWLYGIKAIMPDCLSGDQSSILCRVVYIAGSTGVSPSPAS